MLLKKEIAFYLEDIETPIGKAINLFITILVLLSAGIFVIETYPISESLRLQLENINSIIVIVFIIEYLLRLWCAEDKIKYCINIYSIIDLIAILPFFLKGTVDISFIRILRWFRILRLLRFLNQKTFTSRFSTEDKFIFSRILFTLFAIIFIYSGLIYQVEHPKNSQDFNTFLDAVYFSVVTMTTVGFGDVTPISETGRFLTVLMIFTGIALIPTQVGDLIKRLVKTTNEIETPCRNCGLTFHDNDAEYCKKCGTKLDKII